MLAGVALAAATACAPPRGAHAPATEPLIHPERYAHSIAAVGFPGARRAFQIGSGSVVGGGETALEMNVVSTTSDEARSTPIYFERDGVPVAHWWSIAATDSTHFEAAAIPHPDLGDSNLVLAVRATGRKGGNQSALEVRVRGVADGPHYLPWDFPEDREYLEAWDGRMALRNGRVVAWLGSDREAADGAPAVDRPARTAGRGPGALSARPKPHGASNRLVWEVFLPAYPLEPAVARKLAGRIDFDHVASEARTRWRAELARAAPLATPDSLVNTAYRAALVTLLLGHERSGEDWIPIGNPFQYRDVWLRDGAQVIRALSVAGLTERARADAWAMRRFQFPHGVFISQFGQMDGTGQALWAMHEAASRPPSKEWAQRYLPAASAGVGWIERQRSQLRKIHLPSSGLLPYADPRDNELVRAQLVGNDAWSIAGERAAASLAALAGDDSLARAATLVADDYRAAFVAALARGGFADVPPSWQGPGRDWGNLATAWPARVLAADDPRLASLARRVLGDGRLAGYGADSLHTYLGADLAEWSLIAGSPRLARAWLADLLAHSSSTLGQAEIFSRRDGGFGKNLPPHGTAAARIVQLVRDMIVNDTRDTLEIAAGGDAAWWNGTRFDHAPTRFGVVGLTLERPDSTTLLARWDAVSVPARVRVPDGLVAVAPLPSGATLAGSWLEFPPRATEARVRVAAAPAREVSP